MLVDGSITPQAQGAKVRAQGAKVRTECARCKGLQWSDIEKGHEPQLIFPALPGSCAHCSPVRVVNGYRLLLGVK